VVCDYGCHAFNAAGGNFFEVNCDATKDYYQWIAGHLSETARLFLLNSWRQDQKSRGDYAAVRSGTDIPSQDVEGLASELRRGLARHGSAPGIDGAVLSRRYGWRTDHVPVTPLDRPRIRAGVTPLSHGTNAAVATEERREDPVTGT